MPRSTTYEEPMQKVSVTLQHADFIAFVARKKGTTRSELLRRAVERDLHDWRKHYLMEFLASKGAKHGPH